WVFEQNNDIYFQSERMSYPLAITTTLERESNPQFTMNETAIVYSKNDNLYAWNIADGTTLQLTNFVKGSKPKASPVNTIQETWLKNDQLREFLILSERKNKKDIIDSLNEIEKTYLPLSSLKPVYLDDKFLTSLQISGDGKIISYKLTNPGKNKSTFVPNYVTESAFTESIPGRTKVGIEEAKQELFIFRPSMDTTYKISPKKLEGFFEIPDFYKDYPSVYAKKLKDSIGKSVNYSSLKFSDDGSKAIVDIVSDDHKDRWLCSINFEDGTLESIDHQHDEAWIAGPGIGGWFGNGNQGWVNDHMYYFQSEKSGYSHLYSYDFNSKSTKAITKGNYEVLAAILSEDKNIFYVTTNEVHPGEQQFYQLPVNGGTATRITSMIGAHNVTISPDEKYIAYLYSYTNKPWELYIQENKAGAVPHQITDKAMSPEFKSYAWRDPEVITFSARDGAKVYSRLYHPSKKLANKSAVIFVHGAGYLQNAHKWWSSYFREYMFHNLLVDQGYTVIDIDYRGSAGYGRDWRTGIYRFMGGKDLNDQVDAANFLVNNMGIRRDKIGIYGGSYGGFITLMGLFNSPETFAAGAALRPVTDWAQYNHPYTSNILNEPADDSIAYKKSSPFYYAAGLNKPLLICHGMVDVNVHYQDAVKLAQRLIELKKDNWELASYPMESHGFVEPSSWTDEYKRILKLFNQWLK
ncbi:MAG: prolyl oligopeptidase family serine peptidase, partial [Saprospiraceae bacterium]